MTMKAKILVVEDEDDINKLLCSILEDRDYEVKGVFSGTESLIYIEKYSWDMILLDLMLPGISGEKLIIKIREITKAPIIVISAKSDRKVKLELLDNGADDFIVKPFDPEELIARVDANIRRYLEFSCDKDKSKKLFFKDIILDKDTMEVFVDGNKISLRHKEFEILELLLSNPKKIFSKANIFETLWGDLYLGDDNTVNVHMSRLRNKLLKANNKEDYIETIWGMGYRLKK